MAWMHCQTAREIHQHTVNPQYSAFSQALCHSSYHRRVAALAMITTEATKSRYTPTRYTPPI